MKITAVQRRLNTADDLALHAIACGLAWAGLKIADLNRLKTDGLKLETAAGPAFFRYSPAEQVNRATIVYGWLHVRFDDVARAKGAATVSRQRLNPFSGKYNFASLDAAGAMECESALAKLAPTPAATAA